MHFSTLVTGLLAFGTMSAFALPGAPPESPSGRLTRRAGPLQYKKCNTNSCGGCGPEYKQQDSTCYRWYSTDRSVTITKANGCKVDLFSTTNCASGTYQQTLDGDKCFDLKGNHQGYRVFC